MKKKIDLKINIYIINYMDTLINIRETYYRFGRFIAVFVISPILIISGQKYNDNKLILIGIILFLWDGFKLLYQ